jgi:hypothetical protein
MILKWTVKIWRVDYELCEKILIGHTDLVLTLIVTVEQRICSGSYD